MLRLALAALLALSAPAAADTSADWFSRSWQAYRDKFIQADGRVIDYAVVPGVTTSEGQAYALLRAVWAQDRSTFERVLAWTRSNLARPDSPLPAWKWGATGNGWGILDSNTASDADVCLASALTAASRIWAVPDYAAQATAIASAIWKEEVRTYTGRPYLLPGNWAAKEDPVPLNLSYYIPPLLRRLAEVDGRHPWGAVADATYALLALELPVTALPPDWMSLDPSTGKLTLGGMKGALPQRFGADAYRVYLNLALDYSWDGSAPAKSYLEKQTWLMEYFALNGTLPREVGTRAIPRLSGPEPLALHGALLPGWQLLGKPAALRVRALLDVSYRDGLWGAEADYYVQNLVWFGKALAEKRITPWPTTDAAAVARR